MPNRSGASRRSAWRKKAAKGAATEASNADSSIVASLVIAAGAERPSPKQGSRRWPSGRESRLSPSGLREDPTCLASGGRDPHSPLSRRGRCLQTRGRERSRTAPGASHDCQAARRSRGCRGLDVALGDAHRLEVHERLIRSVPNRSSMSRCSRPCSRSTCPRVVPPAKESRSPTRSAISTVS